MSQLESVENLGDTIRVEDFRTGESYIGLIEELDFINKTPSDRRFSGYGGSLGGPGALQLHYKVCG